MIYGPCCQRRKWMWISTRTLQQSFRLKDNVGSVAIKFQRYIRHNRICNNNSIIMNDRLLPIWTSAVSQRVNSLFNQFNLSNTSNRPVINDPYSISLFALMINHSTRPINIFLSNKNVYRFQFNSTSRQIYESNCVWMEVNILMQEIRCSPTIQQCYHRAKKNEVDYLCDSKWKLMQLKIIQMKLEEKKDWPEIFN